MAIDLTPWLDDLEARIDPAVEEALGREWEAFLKGAAARGAEAKLNGIFSPRRSCPAPPRIEWPAISINRAFDDPDAMALAQLRTCSDNLAAASGRPLTVRANYGTCIMPSLFGAELFMMDEALNTLPTNHPLGEAAMSELLDTGVPDPRAGLGARVLEMGEHFRAIGERYPKIGRHVHVYHPDLQGPIDICEMLWGSSMFLAFYQDPQRLKRLLELATETYSRLMRAWTAIIPFRPEINAHWGFLHRGNIVLRDDSAMNLSPEIIAEFVIPYDQHLLREFGGGVIHFCGRGDHFIEQLSALDALTGINMSQPHLNDMETIYRHTVDKGIPLLDFHRPTAEAALAAGRDLKGRVFCG